MKRLLHTSIAAVVLMALGAPVQGATTSSAFNVTASLTSKCEITVAPTDVAFTYTSYQTTAATATGGALTMRCTNLLPYSLSLNAGAGTVIGLAYTLTIPTPTGTGAGLTTANHSIAGSMVSGQSGDCAVGSCSGTAAHTLTVTY